MTFTEPGGEVGYGTNVTNRPTERALVGGPPSRWARVLTLAPEQLAFACAAAMLTVITVLVLI